MSLSRKINMAPIIAAGAFYTFENHKLGKYMNDWKELVPIFEKYGYTIDKLKWAKESKGDGDIFKAYNKNVSFFFSGGNSIIIFVDSGYIFNNKLFEKYPTPTN